MSQHSSCWLARHQFFIKYCITEKETFKGEKKIEFAVSAQAPMISAFYKVINWLYEGKKQVVLHRALQIKFSLLFYYFPSLSTLIFPLPWGTAYMARRMSWLHDKVILLCLHFYLNKPQCWQTTYGKIDYNRAQLYFAEI